MLSGTQQKSLKTSVSYTYTLSSSDILLIHMVSMNCWKNIAFLENCLKFESSLFSPYFHNFHILSLSHKRKALSEIFRKIGPEQTTVYALYIYYNACIVIFSMRSHTCHLTLELLNYTAHFTKLQTICNMHYEWVVQAPCRWVCLASLRECYYGLRLKASCAAR